MEKQKSIFKIVGLSRSKSITCDNGNEEFFWPDTSKITSDRFNALWDMLKGKWKETNAMALIEYDHLSEDGTPVNSSFIRVESI